MDTLINNELTNHKLYNKFVKDAETITQNVYIGNNEIIRTEMIKDFVIELLKCIPEYVKCIERSMKYKGRHVKDKQKLDEDGYYFLENCIEDIVFTYSPHITITDHSTLLRIVREVIVDELKCFTFRKSTVDEYSKLYDIYKSQLK
jgi:hypothetical protein